jgi:cytochrome c oxidase assembly protein subunit 15
LTDSGLGCPDWPGCYGAANPFMSHAAISAAQSVMPQGPVTHFKAWVEMIHRYLAASVGILILTQVIIATIKRKKFQGAPLFATALLFMVVLQGAFGMWTVTMKLQPVIVTTHLMLAMILLAMLAWLAARITAQTPLTERVAHEALKLKWAARLAWLILLMQIALGGWVSTNYAVLACTDYPLCHGVLIPAMDFDHGFSLWRELGKTVSGEYLSFDALTAIHWVHRNFALLVILSSGYVALRARKMAGVNRIANGILIVLLIQFCSGLANILFSWPLPVAVIHNGGAALLLGLMTVLNYRVQSPVDLRRN